MLDYQAALNGYRECAEWADCGPDHETHEKEWSDELAAQMEKDVACFLLLVKGPVADRLAEAAPDYSDERLGHDFWLTRNGHGAGFWDRKELEPESDEKGKSLGDRLSDLAKTFGECDLYVGDDGLVYGM